jgi:hypothetical protein
MSAIVVTQRIIGGKQFGDGTDGTLSQRDLEFICQILNIPNPEQLPKQAVCTYNLMLQTAEQCPNRISPSRTRKPKAKRKKK